MEYRQLAPLRRTNFPRQTAAGRFLKEDLPQLAIGLLLAAARPFGQPLPLAGAYVASLSLGLPSVFAALGAVGGSFLFCEGTQAAVAAAFALLMLAATAIFHGTGLLAARWFLPCMAAAVCALLGAVGQLQTAAQVSLWAAEWASAGAATAVFRRHPKRLLPAALIAGLCALELPVPLGLTGALALAYATGDLGAVILPAGALCAYGAGAPFAVLVPAWLMRGFPPKLRAAVYAVVPCAILTLGGGATVGNAAAVGLGILGGAGLARYRRRQPETVEGEDEMLLRLRAAAEVLEELSRRLPENAPSAAVSEATGVYDSTAERICRCCPGFHRCWQHRAQETYRALSGAAKQILERGTAHAEDFPQSFRNDCRHFDGFLTALNQELEGMLFRRRYRMQLRESRQVVAEEFSCVAAYLRAPRGLRGEVRDAYCPVVGISSLGKNGSAAIGDRGICFHGRGVDYFVLLCDGMGTGAGASRLSAETVRTLERLLRVGFAPEGALKVLNGMELLRGTGCFTTVDLLHIDLSDGTASLYKWGAAPSYLRADERVEKLGMVTPPPGVGVGGEALPERYDLSLKWGEILVIVSDGAGREDLEERIAAFQGQSPQEMAALLLADAPREDDMTAVCISLRPK